MSTALHDRDPPNFILARSSMTTADLIVSRSSREGELNRPVPGPNKKQRKTRKPQAMQAGRQTSLPGMPAQPLNRGTTLNLTSLSRAGRLPRAEGGCCRGAVAGRTEFVRMDAHPWPTDPPLAVVAVAAVSR